MALIVAAFYLVAGVVFGALAGAAGSPQLREVWRLAAWAVSAVAFAAQIAYEAFRLRSPPWRTAWHTALAVALATFGLALLANLHPHDPTLSFRLRLSLLLWPLIAAVPALFVALALAGALAWIRRRT